jgi:hypothetical protein
MYQLSTRCSIIVDRNEGEGPMHYQIAPIIVITGRELLPFKIPTFIQ